jgi:tetratricopeptide (TPR) repeat protein
MNRTGIVSPVLIVSLLCTPVAAQTPTPGPPTQGQHEGAPVVDLDAAEARKAFEEGVAAYQKGDYKGAAERFGQAQLLKPHPEVLLNLAQSQLKAEKFAEAATHFQAYLTQTQRDNPTAQNGLSDAKTQVAEVAVLAPEGTEIIVDQTGVGTAPLTQPLYLVPGRHEVVSGERNETIQVGAGQSTTVDLLSDGEANPGGAATATTDLPANGERLRVDKWFLQRPGAWVGAGITVGSLLFSAVAATTAGRRYDAANDAKRQIQAHYVADGSPGQSPCGPPALNAQYDYACSFYLDNADSGDTWRTASIVTLVVGMLAASGTVAYYFLDPENHAQEDQPPATLQFDADPTTGSYSMAVSGRF